MKTHIRIITAIVLTAFQACQDEAELSPGVINLDAREVGVLGPGPGSELPSALADAGTVHYIDAAYRPGDDLPESGDLLGGD